MKKIKGFTLLEMIIVIALIGIVATSRINGKRNLAQSVDTGREVVNVVYKEMDQYLKDFQRNKIYEDNDGNIYEIEYFILDFGEELSSRTGSQIIIGNDYGENIYFNSGTLISGQKYSAFQYLKGTEGYTFYTRNKSGGDGEFTRPIRISSNGKLYKGTDRPTTTTTPESNSDYQFVICGGEGGKIEHIGAITINAISKESRLDRCETERYAGIDCSIFVDC